jgi:hypothetical protein
MKANELRIGNWVEYRCYDELATPKDEWVINPIDIDDLIYIFETPNPIDYRYIPLTEEWLVKLGGVPNPYQDRYEFGKIYVHIDKTKGITEIWIDYAPHIKYVHQFQNYVHARTGEELTLTP